MEATETLMRESTTFMIAHRLSTLKYCDVILRLEDGEVVGVESELPELATLPQRVGPVPRAHSVAAPAAGD